MKTLEQIIEWLKTPDKIPVLLVEIPSILPGSATMYLSSKPFVTSPTDTIPNTYYTSCVVGGINFTESLSLTGAISISFGDIELDNTEGARDSWLTDYVWTNKSIKILIGDISWERDDFRDIFNGIIAEISSKSSNSLNIIIADKLQRLNNPISEELIPVFNSNSDVLVPVTFGEVFNATPITSSTIANTLEYQVHTGPIEDIIEVRDNGVPVNISKNLSAGKFTLNQSPYGQITCSIQGDKEITYINDIANIVKRIVKSFGPVDTRLTDSDIDSSNFTTFSSTYTQPVGIYISSRENILNVCNQLAASVGAQLTVSSTGLLRLIRLSLPPTGGVSYTIGNNDIEYNSLTISEKSEIRAATKLGYCKNYTDQTGNISAGVPSNNAVLFDEEFLYETVVDPSVQSTYKLTSEPITENTLLLQTSDAQAEAVRRNNLWKEPRFVISFKAYGHLLPVELGDTINITGDRFGLQAEKSGLVVRISRDWLNARITIGILV